MDSIANGLLLPQANRMKVVIAHYKLGAKVLLTLLFYLSFPVLILYLTFFFQNGTALEQLRRQHSVLMPAVVLVWLGSAFSFWVGLVLGKRIVAQNRAALWIENGEIVGLHRLLLRAKTTEVSKITYGTIGRFETPSIILHMKNGAQKGIPTESLVEPKELIFSRLEQAIAG